MSDPQRQSISVAPFSFSGWGEEGEIPHVRAGNFKSERIFYYAGLAKMAEDMGNFNNATFFRKNAERLKASAEGPSERNKQMEPLHALAAGDAVAFLLSQAGEGSEDAMKALRNLTDQLLKGLFTLTAHNHSGATAVFMHSLGVATGEFTTLMNHNPEQFLSFTRRAGSIPGLISQVPEDAKFNAETAGRLQVGEDNPIRLPRGKKKGISLKTPVNRWAVRLIEYVRQVRKDAPRLASMASAQRAFYTPPHLYSPSWLPAALALDEFSASNWQKWLEVAWEVVLDASEGHPESVPVLFSLGKHGVNKGVSYTDHPTEGTKQSNVKIKIKERLQEAFRSLSGDNKSFPKDF